MRRVFLHVFVTILIVGLLSLTNGATLFYENRHGGGGGGGGRRNRGARYDCSLNCPFGYEYDVEGRRICECRDYCKQLRCYDGYSCVVDYKCNENGSNCLPTALCKLRNACGDPINIDRSTCARPKKRWYYDTVTNRCYHYLGCPGEGNNFARKYYCKRTCKRRLHGIRLPYGKGQQPLWRNDPEKQLLLRERNGKKIRTSTTTVTSTAFPEIHNSQQFSATSTLSTSTKTPGEKIDRTEKRPTSTQGPTSSSTASALTSVTSSLTSRRPLKETRTDTAATPSSRSRLDDYSWLNEAGFNAQDFEAEILAKIKMFKNDPFLPALLRDLLRMQKESKRVIGKPVEEADTKMEGEIIGVTTEPRPVIVGMATEPSSSSTVTTESLQSLYDEAESIAQSRPSESLREQVGKPLTLSTASSQSQNQAKLDQISRKQDDLRSSVSTATPSWMSVTCEAARPAACKRNPCELCRDPTIVCVPVYCGKCAARFFQVGTGVELTACNSEEDQPIFVLR